MNTNRTLVVGDRKSNAPLARLRCDGGDDDKMMMRWRVEESGCGDRIDPVMRSVFGVGRKSHRKSFPVAGDGGGGGGGVAGGGRSN
ncbi:hypothetical protein Tco_1165688 [Tanacetum coccineum]